MVVHMGYKSWYFLFSLSPSLPPSLFSSLLDFCFLYSLQKTAQTDQVLPNYGECEPQWQTIYTHFLNFNVICLGITLM